MLGVVLGSALKRRGSMFATLVVSMLLVGCTPSVAPAMVDGADDDVLRVYATTGYLADAVSQIAPDAVVTTMVGPGGDPHTYQPSTRDIETLLNADVVLWNGLHLEAQMLDQLGSLGERQLAVGDQLPEDLLLDWPETDDAGNPLHDPHVWNSPAAWSLIVEQVADKLAATDPEHAAEYERNARGYLIEIDEATRETAALLADIPEERRILITGHDAFAYFGDTYGLEVRATDFVSTEAALSPEELSGLANLITEHRVPVIFQDNQANPQAIISLKEAVRSRGWDVEVSDAELYADSLGADPGVDSYLSVFRHNSRAIADALAGSEEP